MRDGARVITVQGAFDMVLAPRVERALREAVADPGQALVVDLSECEFIDSTGLTTLLSAAKALPDDQIPILLASPPSSEVRRMLDLVGISLSVSTFDTVGDAIAASSSADGD